MYGEIDILSAISSINEIDINGFKEQFNCFEVTFSCDIDMTSIQNAIKLYDTVENSFIDCYLSYSKKKAKITPKTVYLIKDRKYTIQIVSGKSGIKNILGAYIENNILYDIIFSDEVLVRRPTISLPVNNSKVEDVLIKINQGLTGIDSYIIEIDDNLSFSNPNVSSDIYDISTAYVPAGYTFSEGKQYFVRTYAKRISGEITYKSNYSDIVQFSTINKKIVPVTSSFSLKYLIPNDNAKYMSSKKLIYIFNEDISTDTITVGVYNSDITYKDMCIEDINTMFSAGICTTVNSTFTVSKNTLTVDLTDEIVIKKEYYTSINISGSHTYSNVFSYESPIRTLYIDYEYIKDDLSQFDVTEDYVKSKIAQACDRADYSSLITIDAGTSSTEDYHTNYSTYEIKQFVRYRTLIDILTDYQLGYINLVSGAIGSFQFQVSGSTFNTISDAVKRLEAELHVWYIALRGYRKSGNVPPSYAQRDAANTISRTSI